MASNERNALAELAETLKYHIEPRRLNADKDEFAVACCKALRIIAELANVGFLKTAYGGTSANHLDACFAVERCRAIAEE